MANVPISALPVATSLSASDIAAWVVSGTTSRVAYSVLQTLVLNPSATTSSLSGANTVVFLIGGVPTAISWTNLQTLIQASVRQSGIPITLKSVDYTLVLTDGGTCIAHPGTDNNPRTFTIPANASVAFPDGSVVTFVNGINTISIAINGGDSLVLAGIGTLGTRTLAAYGVATAMKLSSTVWYISGTGLS